MRGFITPSLTSSRFRFALGFLTLRLAYMLDSLVRVSRRVIQNRFTSFNNQLARTLPRAVVGPSTACADTEPPPPDALWQRNRAPYRHTEAYVLTPD